MLTFVKDNAKGGGAGYILAIIGAKKNLIEDIGEEFRPKNL